MPPANRFRHQHYTDARPTSPYHLITPEPYPEVGSMEFQQRMRAVGDIYRTAGIVGVYLVHGTFVGQDARGLWTELSRLLPSAGDALRSLSKKWIDTAIGEHGNFTEHFARLFEQSIAGSGQPIPVRLFCWSSENHHIGRADGAIRLLDELDRIERPGRVLLWGHSHGGNVFALLSNLLAGDSLMVQKFFQAAHAYYRSPVTRRVDLPVWERIERRLNENHPLLTNNPLDFVTFGTPIRYGWDSNGYHHLLHFVNHRPASGRPEYLARFPVTRDDILNATDGDYIQQIGIAGTNLLPSFLAWRAILADRRLHQLLQSDVPAGHLRQRLKIGRRVPDEGTTLLVDYGPPQGNVTQHLAGHAVYTQTDWLLFHAEQTARFLYGDS